MKTKPWVRPLASPGIKVALAVILIANVTGLALFIHYYNQFATMIDKRLNGELLAHPSLLFAAPQVVSVGEPITVRDVAEHLRRAGYNSAQVVGSFKVATDQIQINPGAESFHSPEDAVIKFAGKKVASITDPTTGQELQRYDLEPELLTTLFDEQRSKRRLLKYGDLPQNLINAVLAAEDRDYFHHGAINYWRILAAAYRDLRSGRREQGGSTITMQVARNFFLVSEKNQKSMRRKMAEMLIAFELEQRLTKEQIFELYANEAYEGQHGTYSINGFGQAASAYFNKDVDQLSLAECALIAGIIHGPNADSPYRYPQRALLRRNRVLRQMAEAGFITEKQRATATAQPLGIAITNTEASEAPYFVDLVRDQVSDHLSNLSRQSFHIYTTLDPDLQRAASDAVDNGMKLVDARLAKLYARKRRKGAKPVAIPRPQVALIALDPHTGAVKALIGGRNYAASQLDHALALRPTGSIFKPLVFAAALNTAIDNTQPIVTASTQVMDQPTTFEDGYQPANFEQRYLGKVALRQALEHSLNNATISLAQQIGYQRVADLAHEAGINSVRATPSMAIGAYAATPLDMAQAYTIFANDGVRVQPRFLYSIQTASGEIVYQEPLKTKRVLDARINYLMTNLMQSVMDNGTAAAVRAMDFESPAAGKTGTSHDGWFAGYTSNLLCIVWVGNDDYSVMPLEGAHSALPIWGEFMKRAIKLPAYHDVTDFKPPAGVVAVRVDDDSMQVATPLCPKTHIEYYIEGTQPTQECQLHSPNLSSPKGLMTRIFGGLVHSGPQQPAAPAPTNAAAPASPKPLPVAASQPQSKAPAASTAEQQPPKKKKKGFFARIFGGSKADKTQPQPSSSPE